jgi:hypothetical protein
MTTTPTTTEPVTVEALLERIANRRAAVFNTMLYEQLAGLRAKGWTEPQIAEANEQALTSFGETLRAQLAAIASEIDGLLPHRQWN